MLGAFVACMGLSFLGLNYWVMLILAPLVVGLFGIVIEKLLLKHLYKLDHLYGLLLTFGLTLLIEGLRSEEHTSELQSLMRISYAVFCLKKKKMTKQKF